KMFLPDRYVKGTCPCCKTPDQYGDNCEVCGSTYSPLDLIDPKSTISGITPIAKESEHYFFKLSHYSDFLREWIMTKNHLAEEISNKLLEWFKEGLHDLDISRDSPYFGFKIPGADNKFFYVWIDAPIGYMATFKNLCQHRDNLNFDEYWSNAEKTELYHFVGKDIINFHAIFWPAILKSADFRRPTAIFVHGYVTVNGKKMSKSRGTFITAHHYLNYLDPEYLRYYYATKLTRKAEDIDFNFEDFIQKINSDLIGKLVNIASRCASFINKKFANQLSSTSFKPEFILQFVNKGNEIADYYESRDYNRAMKSIMELADQANQMIDAEKPWLLIKNSDSIQQAHDVCSLGLNLFRILMIYLKPVLPITAEKVEHFLNIPAMTWDQRQKILLDHTINTFTPLLQRIPEEAIQNIQKTDSIGAD
ncbi:MAG: methionine--tRNA ligase, partial [Pseudomonadota bacterium]